MYPTTIKPFNMKSLKFRMILLIPFVIFSFQDCKKNLSSTSSPNDSQAMIELAHSYFDQSLGQSGANSKTGNPRIDAIKNPQWDLAYIAHLSTGDAVIVPVFYQKDLVVIA